MPDGMTEFFLAVIDNPRTGNWFSRMAMGERSLSSLMKQIFEENGLDLDEFSNKSGRTTLVTRMAEAGVPAEVGMLVTGHNSKKAYSHYNWSKEAKVRAAQRCSTHETLTYVEALEQETLKLRLAMIEGVESELAEGNSGESPPKRQKSSEEEDISATKDSVAMKLIALKIGSPSVSNATDAPAEGLTAKNVKGKRVRELEQVDGSDWDRMKHFDWESDLKVYEEGRSVNINPISALLGKLVNCNGIVINFNGNVNFKA